MTPYEGAERKNADGARMQARDIGVVEGSVCVPGRTGEVPPQGAFLAQPRTESPNHECNDGRFLAQRCTIELRGCPGSVVQHQNKGESPAPDPQALLRRPRQAQAETGDTAQNKILESSNGEWMDTRAPGTAVPAYPHLATVGESHRTKNTRRKSQGVA
ncbi:hypothetical protein [Variovorax sp. PAMC26660]|uniref:hypothetical protein n=1 Tax=Variovorax sp. PAMC26660 TaxID=2762322 RepID=UPI00164E23F0|nr:hypothetical protein [Variovorax sp. PAMC26660]QNK67697.1 hypothetical protein H7F35_31940 [Variovorax sp. PAMC26660]